MAMSTYCGRCGGSLVTITFSIEGAPRTMRSCSACDHRTWLAGSRPIELDGILAELSDVRRVPTGLRR
ncbi:MAG TPA: hypothetical protein VGQ20_16640 [Acidimicrobiales bacterium]|nr:hypothetical protein [Acidimicrobiales bacterium]